MRDYKFTFRLEKSMRIFLSHSSKQKPLVREVRNYLPKYLEAWIDEEKLLFGDNITLSLEDTIKSDTDYVLLFIDNHAATSSWVGKEIDWALQAEKEYGRIILLPIAIDVDALNVIGNIELQNRKYIQLKDFQESSVRALSDAIASDLFALVCRDMDRLRAPQPKAMADAIADADKLVQDHALLVRKAVFPHRKSNPIATDTLLEVINSQNECIVTMQEFEKILSAVTQRNLIPGLQYDGFELFLREEHASWKSEIQHNKKERVGRKAAQLIRNGMKVILDAGSTTEEVASIICKRIETRALTKISIVTTSVNIADMISDCCVKMGFDDDFSAVKLFIPGGSIRPNTQAIVPIAKSQSGEVLSIAKHLGGFDLGIVGVNGIDPQAGLTTHANAESQNKHDIIQASSDTLVIGDSSKIGIKLEHKFADLSNNLHVIIDDDPISQDFRQSMGELAKNITLA